ncbi:MAG TPA: bifunctional phosphoribosylaminoimidazolecarboxamide formyltransferase/IMP cyclohydrolase [Chitinophagaceae bacterium]|nr:bifunctional phosphoribosylaminoimidazolecarboxamide formyltransferase/IMP cyclohydrolase [Chitinophagaceae bacterium]
MNKKIKSALISVFYKDGLENIVKLLHDAGIVMYSTGGTQQFIEKLGVPVTPVEQLTTYPSILGGRVKTLHPVVFGGILGRRSHETDVQEMQQYKIPEIDLVIVDLYPFEETVASTNDHDAIIEKIDVGGPSMIRGAAKNFKDVLVIASKSDYPLLENILSQQSAETTLEQRRQFAAKAFDICAHYDVAIAKFFNPGAPLYFLESVTNPTSLRYGENPHQQALFYGNPDKLFEQLHGKELSYNNLVDLDAALQLINEFSAGDGEITFAIIKHTNVCGIASRQSTAEAWMAALAGDPESAFGGVLVCNGSIDEPTASAINEIFFEVLIAPTFDDAALSILQQKKNRILLRRKDIVSAQYQYRSLLNGVLTQTADIGNFTDWKETGGRTSSEQEKADMLFANIVCKHLKSNAIALVKNKQLAGKGCGQTSRIDALRHAIEKAKQFRFDLQGAVMASDAFFPFSDCVQMGHEAGITAFIQPGGSIRDKDSIEYCLQHNLAMVLTGQRHFRH